MSASPKLRTAGGRGWPWRDRHLVEKAGPALKDAVMADGPSVIIDNQSNLRLEFRHEHEINGSVRATDIPLEKHVDIVRHKDSEIGQLQKLLDGLISHDMAMISFAELQRAIASRRWS